MNEVAEESFVGKSEILNLFDLPPTQLAIQDGSYIVHKCSQVSDEHSIVFNFGVDENHFYDLSKSYMTFNVKIDGAAATAKTVGPVNLWGHSCFQSIALTLNNERVTLASSDLYPYEAMLTTLLSYGSDAKKTHLAVAGFASDEGGKMDDFDPTEDDCNPGLVKRAAGINTGAETEMLIRPHVNMFQQERLLPPGTKIGLTLIPSSHHFNLMADDGASKYKTKITNPRLHVRRVALSKTEEMSLITEKMKGSALRYPVRDLRCKQRLITTGSTDFDETISQGVIPRRLWVCMVDQDARAGNYKKNPFNFQHYNLSSIQLRVAGKMVPLEAIQANFGANKYKHLYFNLFSQMDNLFDDRGNGITYEDFKQGFAIFAFDLTADLEDGEHMELTKRGTVDLVLRFKTGTPNAISLIHMAEFENIISISGSSQEVSRTWTHGN